MPRLNRDLLKRTMRHILRYPEKHNQMNWCGTACCFAGRAAILAGYRPENTESTHLVYRPGTRRRRYLDVPQVAERELGLTRVQAAMLFNGFQTRRQLAHTVDRILVEDMAKGHPKRKAKHA